MSAIIFAFCHLYLLGVWYLVLYRPSPVKFASGRLSVSISLWSRIVSTRGDSSRVMLSRVNQCREGVGSAPVA